MSTGLPEMPGIDLEEGLRHLLNRVPLYEKILRDFQGRFANETDRIRAALAAGDPGLATRLAHSLKSTSATIGAGTLSGLAAELERAIRTGDPRLPDCLLRFDRELRLVVGSIKTGFGLP